MTQVKRTNKFDCFYLYFVFYLCTNKNKYIRYCLIINIIYFINVECNVLSCLINSKKKEKTTDN